MIERPPDPVAEGLAYQRLLLDALGDDDAERVLTGTAGDIRAVVAAAGPDLRTRPAPGEWSVLRCVAHLVDAEVAWAPRFRFVLAHDRPELPGYDQDLWNDRLHADDENPDALLRLFEPLRASLLELSRRTTGEARERVGLHRERGEESFDLMFRMLAGHDRIHLAQAREALAAVRG